MEFVFVFDSLQRKWSQTEREEKRREKRRERRKNRGEGGVKREREEEGYDPCVFTTVYTESDSDSISAAAVT